MGQSLWNKHNGQEREIKDYAWNFGPFEAMREYGDKDYLAFCKYIVRASGDPDFVNKCIANSASGKSVYSRIVDELIRKYVDAQTRNEEVAQRNRILEEKIKLVDQDNQRKALALLSVVQKV